MQYALTLVSLSLGTLNGFFQQNKQTNKAAMLKYFFEDFFEDVQYPQNAFYIQDGSTLFHSLTNLADAIEGIRFQLLDIMISKTNFLFSVDSYFPHSIKPQERLHLGWSQPHFIGGPSTRRSADFKAFLNSDENKRQLCQKILKVWSSIISASHFAQCGTPTVAVEGKAFQLNLTCDKVKV